MRPEEESAEDSSMQLTQSPVKPAGTGNASRPGPASDSSREKTSTPHSRRDDQAPAMSISAASVSVSTSHAHQTLKHRPQSSRPTVSDSTSTTTTAALPSTPALELMMHAMQSVQQMEVRMRALEDENRAAKEKLREMRTNAMNWCSLAKKYQQDRNFIGVQLSELEVMLAEAQKRRTSTENAQTAKGTTAADADTADHIAGTDPGNMGEVISQSISQLLDTVAHANGGFEPKLPPLSKGHYSLEGKRSKGGRDGTSSSSTGPSTITQPRSVLKTSSKASSCTCGCQEELRAWKMRCAFAENQIPILEMRCEKQTTIMEAYKAKWSQWKEAFLRSQYERRLKAAMPPQQYARFRASSSTSDLQQQGSLPHGGGEQRKRTRFTNEGSMDGSQQRQETTQKNTLYNQFGAGLPFDTTTPMGSFNRPGVRFRSGSATEPHILFDEDSDDAGTTMTPIPRNDSNPTHFILDSDDEGPGPESASQPKSLTFPSDLALRRRELLSEEDADDDERNYHHRHHPESRSPTVRAAQYKSLKRPASRSSLPQPSTRNEANDTTKAVESSRAQNVQSLPSDRSSPPMFEYSLPTVKIVWATSVSTTKEQDDRSRTAGSSTTAGSGNTRDQEVATEARSSTVVMSGAQAANPETEGNTVRRSSIDSRMALGPGQSRKPSTPQKSKVYVPETPLELQGMTPRRGEDAQSTGNGQAPMQEAIPLTDFGNAPIQRPVSKISVQAQGQQQQRQRQRQGQRSDRETTAQEEIGAEEHEEEWPGLDNVEDVIPEHLSDDRAYMDVDDAPGTSRAHHQQLQFGQGSGDERIYNFTERRKDKRKQMHGHDCACCRKFYKLTGPLPLPDGYNAFFTPAPRPGEKEIWEQTPEERLQNRIQEVSRHRVQHEVPLTPPGFWDTNFPLTPERVEWDRIAEERKERKRQRSDKDSGTRGRGRGGGGGGQDSGHQRRGSGDRTS
ncbi:hypothetical protein BGZ83_006726 [Gryganskiella cystojenkinii]|nr:hypothetical protein BGZ83_006726 [Gryganskiella cystojenkinii]